ncbi:MAG: A/G-specific adenine glycosylase [Actinobacteria bacterium]|nr:A/G-specific adenine glycosylase [Actinomycetota bacterium]
MAGHPDAEAILRWYAAVRRDLPWRRTSDPYRILVSEVMLQQTQVARVVPYYEAWLERFPSAGALAVAPAAEVLRMWSGLGYNRRALALQAACGVVARDGWPQTVEGLMALPGVGPYTAAAVASFAFGVQAAAVDTNVRRVIERLDRRARRPPELARRADALVPAGRAADWNQALMELGATVCTARAPACEACPAASCRSQGRPQLAPTARRGAADRVRFEETDRYVRGRVVAALVAGAALPDGFAPERLERALAGLERDGLVVREAGAVRLP